MERFRLYNKLSGKQCFEFGSCELFDRSPDGGMMPVTAVLEDQIGSETVLLLIDKTPFIHEVAKVRPFDLHLKTGLVRTHNGPLIFMLFLLPDPWNPGEVFATWECHVNPFEPAHMNPFRDLARQSHCHVALLGKDAHVVDLLEFENRFNLDLSLPGFEQACRGLPHGNFDLAKMEFCERYTTDDLLLFG